MEGGLGSIVWRERWRIGTWVGPALLLLFFAHQVILPMAERYYKSKSRLSSLKENTYESSWLDSTQSALQADADLLKAFHASRKGALSADSSVQAAVDRIRALAQSHGFEVIKTTPILAQADSLTLLKVRLEGYALYGGLIDLFSVLRNSHPDLYLDEMLIRQGGERTRGRLEGVLVLHTYAENRGALK